MLIRTILLMSSLCAPTRSAVQEAYEVPSSATGTWIGTWSVSPQSGNTAFHNQTIRQIVRTSIGGSIARIQLSNVFGTQAVDIGQIHIALATSGSSVDVETDCTVMFNGSGSTILAGGAVLVSDEIPFVVNAFSDIAISIYLPSPTGLATYHEQGTQTNYIASGDVCGNSSLVDAEMTSHYFFLMNIDVRNPTASGAVVTLGASITDGYGAETNMNHRWPNELAVRLVKAGLKIGVLNQGISGNRLLADGAGESALNRFKRDVIDQPGVRWVIFSDDPINDLGAGTNAPTASELITGLVRLISEAHQNGLKFFCSTLTPFEGADYWTSVGEVRRQVINAFIRGGESGCDGVIDQDAATHDPSKPTTFLPEYDIGDHLHPNEAGLRAIAEAVDLGLFSSSSAPIKSGAGSDRRRSEL